MDLGWIRVSQPATPRLSSDAIGAVTKHGDSLGFDQIWLPELSLGAMNQAPRTQNMRIGFNLAASDYAPPRRLAHQIREAQMQFGDKFIIGLSQGTTRSDQVGFEQVETLLTKDPRKILPSDMPLAPPCPEVLLQAPCGTPPDMRRGAHAGFNVLSSAWQGVNDLARHWGEVVTGATHAARRARPAQWHVARLVFLSDDATEISAYTNGLAKDYLQAASPEGLMDPMSDRIIAGPARHVAARLLELRQCIGPFGTLHIVDPGLRPDGMATQMSRMAFEVMPHVLGTKPVPTNRELENT